MKKINEDFDIPYYIFEELIDFIEDKVKGNLKIAKRNNIQGLLNLAVLNKRISKEQADFLEQKYIKY